MSGIIINSFVVASLPLLVGVDADWTNSGSVASSTTLTVNLPVDAAVGDLCFFATTNTSSLTCTWTAGWTELDDRTTTRPLAYCYKVLDSADISAGNVTCTFSGTASTAQGVTFIVRNHNVATSAPEDNTGAAGTSTTPNPDSTSPSWGTAASTCYVAIYAGADLSASPSGYTTLFAFGSLGVHAAYKIATSASDDPETFTQASSTGWRTNTIAVRGLI
jgi:hypothetical protein